LATIDQACFAGTLDDAAGAVLDRVADGEGGYACLCNVHVLVSACRHDKLARALHDSWTAFPDGAPVAWLQRRSGDAGAARIAGADLMERVLDTGRPDGLSHFLFGSTPAVLDGLVARFSKTFPGARIAGVHSPPFGSVESLGTKDVLDRIRDAKPSIVWCGLGAPKQELWMRRHSEDLAPSVLIGVGAAFDFLSGTKERAPEWMRQAGLEWLHRLGSEPRRLAGRYVVTNTEFAIRTAFELSARRSGS
jgi:N-acetylglucosaminyldiphosphoundecaprenol N-acetyl-beta-D-mannosaminyltransferase